MKTKLNIALLALIMIFVASCNKKDEVTPGSSNAPVASSDAARKSSSKAIETHISGVVDGKNFSGILRITRFILKDSNLFAVGQITKIKGLHPHSDAHMLLATQEFQLPVILPQGTSAAAAADGAAAAASCNILNLVLGPLDLNLLGLQIHLNQVLLNVIGQTGAGNLLGNLLCAITGLLNPLGNLLQLLDLLNQLIALIGTL